MSSPFWLTRITDEPQPHLLSAPRANRWNDLVWDRRIETTRLADTAFSSEANDLRNRNCDSQVSEKKPRDGSFDYGHHEYCMLVFAALGRRGPSQPGARGRLVLNYRRHLENLIDLSGHLTCVLVLVSCCGLEDKQFEM